MNKLVIIGRITKDLEVKTSKNGKSYLFFSIAVDRAYKDAQGNRTTDFIDCRCFGKTAEIIGRYFGKGQKIGVVGSLETYKSPGADGKDVTFYYVNVSEFDFIESRKEAAPAQAPIQGADKKVQASLDLFQVEAQAAAESGALPFEV